MRRARRLCAVRRTLPALQVAPAPAREEGRALRRGAWRGHRLGVTHCVAGDGGVLGRDLQCVGDLPRARAAARDSASHCGGSAGDLGGRARALPGAGGSREKRGKGHLPPQDVLIKPRGLVPEVRAQRIGCAPPCQWQFEVISQRGGSCSGDDAAAHELATVPGAHTDTGGGETGA